jgi:thiol-disulfide isomerase/thioredoxin
MRKLFILFLAVLAGATGLLIGIATSRSGRTVFAKSARSARPASPAALKPASSRQLPSGPRIIQFANNPEPVPPFLVNNIMGGIVSTASWHGKVVILNFWATWCPPCRDEIPELIDLTNQYKDRLQIIGISVDDSPPEEVRAFAAHMSINYPVVMASRELISEYGGVPALPTSFIIDTNSRVVQKHVGLYPREVYETEIRSLLGLPVDATVETFKDTGQIFLKNAALATELPGVDLKKLTPDQRKAALKRLNSETCNCGCGLTLAQCRINDTSCPISLQLAQDIVKKAASLPAAPPAPAAAPPSGH